ncbi:unnamed protein product, partial [Pelagomonas calceolata]
SPYSHSLATSPRGSLVHAVRVAAGPVRLGHAVRGRLRARALVPRQALAVRGERRRAIREASRAGGGVLRRAKSVTRSHALCFWTLRPHCDVLLHACCRKTVKELLRGLLAALGGQGEAVWQRQLRIAARSHLNQSSACGWQYDDVSTDRCTVTPLAQYREQ